MTDETPRLRRASHGGNVDVSGMGDLAQPWIGPFTKLEVGGFAFVGLIAAVVYFRMRKK